MLLLHVLGILCGLAVVAFATLEAGRLRGAGAFLGALAAASIVIGTGRVPDPVWAACFAAGGAVLALSSRAPLVALACGGALAGIWAAVLRGQGAPMLLAVAYVIAMAGLSNRLAARSPAYATIAMREEAFMLVAVIALALAAAPAIVEGWQSAAALRAAPLQSGAAGSSWAIALAGAALVIGGIYSMWRRR